MSANNYWRLCDELTVIQATLLILGIDPEDHTLESFNPEPIHKSKRALKPDGFNAVFSAITNSIKNNQLSAKIICRDYNYNCEPYVLTQDSQIVDADWNLTLIKTQDLKKFLQERGVRSGFFFETESIETSDILSANNPYYAPKLAAAISAWLEVTSTPELISGKSPKKALEIWLRKHANNYGLTKDDGNPNEQGIDEICKIANWKPSGGASPTAHNDTPSKSDMTRAIIPLKKLEILKFSDPQKGDLPF